MAGFTWNDEGFDRLPVGKRDMVSFECRVNYHLDEIFQLHMQNRRLLRFKAGLNHLEDDLRKIERLCYIRKDPNESQM